MLNGSSPASRHFTGGDGIGRRLHWIAASRISRICSGVVPQHPPTMLISPLEQNSCRISAVSRGNSSYSPNALGRPALGYAQT